MRVLATIALALIAVLIISCNKSTRYKAECYEGAWNTTMQRVEEGI